MELNKTTFIELQMKNVNRIVLPSCDRKYCILFFEMMKLKPKLSSNIFSSQVPDVQRTTSALRH